MYKDFMNLKIYDKKKNNNESLAEIYNLLTEEFKSLLLESFLPAGEVFGFGVVVADAIVT
jgi:hypothetical protein